MGQMWSGEPARAENGEAQDQVDIAQSLLESIAPSAATVKATPHRNLQRQLDSIRLFFNLNGSEMTTVWIEHGFDRLGDFVNALDAGQDYELSTMLRSQGDSLVFHAPQLVTHLPLKLYGKPLADALRACL